MQMDPKRLLLMVVFAFSVIMLWDKWSAYNAPKKLPEAAQSAAMNQGGAVPAPIASGVVGSAANPGVISGGVESRATGYAAAAKAIVKTDTMVATISAQGGDVVRVELLQHKQSDDHTKNFVVLQDDGAHFYVANSGFTGDGLPNH